MAIPPREAFFHQTRPSWLTWPSAGSAPNSPWPYPPGIPVLAPGEVITADALAATRAPARRKGGSAYAADPSLATFQVIAKG